MKRHKVFVTRTLPVDPLEICGNGIDVEVFAQDRSPTTDELQAGIQGATGLVSLLTDPIDGALLGANPSLRIVANVAVGYNNIDVEVATQKGIWVTNTPGVLTEATADGTWALILAAARRVGEGERLLRSGQFTGWSPTLLLGKELRGATLGIFGFGRIGQAVARRAVGFGMHILYHSRSVIPEEITQPLGARLVSKEELLSSSDILTIHCPLTNETHHTFDGAAFATMKKGSILINTARGPVVDEEALVQALTNGHLTSAGLDVFENEPTLHPELVKMEQVVLLPHIASATWETRRKMATMALENVNQVLRGERPTNAVNEVV